MRLASWLECVRHRLQVRSHGRRPQKLALPSVIETCEQRTLLSVSALFIGGELNVASNAGDSITIRESAANPGRVEVLANGAAVTSLPPIAANQVTSIVVLGGDDDNVIDLSGVSSAVFTALTRIDVDGANGDDQIIGSLNIGSQVRGSDGNDVLTGLDGNDALDGGDGDDTIFSGLGNDNVTGANGADLLIGEAGNDTIVAGDGTDSVDGGDGNDTIEGGNGNDTLLGGLGNDFANSGSGDDELQGDAGDDTLLAGGGNDSAFGGDGNDSLDGQGGADTLHGELGNDSLEGNAGNDSLLGQDGNDFLNGSLDNDTVEGGDDSDTLFGGAGNDSLLGSSGNDSLKGQGGNDTLIGGSGSNKLEGGSGDDLLDARSVTISINDVTVTEGNSGTSDAVFTVSLNTASDLPVTVDFNTANASANAGLDYQFTAGTLTFNPGEVLQTIAVPAFGETLDEPDETFFLNLSNPTNASIVDRQGQGRILNDGDTDVGISINDLTIDPEGNTGTTNVVFTVTLTPASTNTVTVNFATANASATAGMDFTATNGTLMFAPGTTTQQITVSVAADVLDESNETFFVNLSNAMNAVIVDGQGVGRIIDDDGPPTSRLFAVPEDGTNSIVELDLFTGIELNRFATPQVVVGNGGDGLAFNGSSLFFISQTTLWELDPNTGSVIDSDAISTARGALDGLATLNGLVYILHEDFNAGDDRIRVFNPATDTIVSDIFPSTALFDALAAIRSTPSALIARVGNTIREVDAMTGTLGPSFVPNATGAGSVQGLGVVNGEIYVGSSATQFDVYSRGGVFQRSVTLPYAISAFGADDIASIVSGGVTISVDDVTVDPEGDSGFRSAVFTVTLSATSTSPVTVEFATAGGSAVAGVDFQASSGILTFAANQTSPETITIQIVGDTLDEVDESFFINLSNPTNATIADNQGIAIIVDDDGVSAVTPDTNTLDGGDGSDTLLGSFGNDVLNGGADNDSLVGADGNDQFFGGAGKDALDGGGGDDTLDGQGGNDNVTGGDGNDLLVWGGAGDGSDQLEGNSGFNSLEIRGTDFNDTLTLSRKLLFSVNGTSIVGAQFQATDGTATITVANDILEVIVNGRTGNDTINVTDLDELPLMSVTVNGDAGNDRIDATAARLGNVRIEINGDLGDDTVIGSEGADVLNGGDGNDQLQGAGGNDTIHGDLGDDSVRGDAGNDILFGDDGLDSLFGGDGNDAMQGGADADFLIGDTGNDTLDGNSGNDIVNGSTGNDLLNGSAGRDTLFGGTGNDTLDGSIGDDSLKGQSGNDLVRGGDGNDILIGEDGNDTLAGQDGDDTLEAGMGNDALNGGDGNDRMNGDFGDDTLLGGDGDDLMFGGAGRDIALGEDGDDYINGNSGFDTVAGGEGDDTIADPVAEIDETFRLLPELLTALNF